MALKAVWAFVWHSREALQNEGHLRRRHYWREFWGGNTKGAYIKKMKQKKNKVVEFKSKTIEMFCCADS